MRWGTIALAALCTLLPIGVQMAADRHTGWLMVDFRAYYCASLAQRERANPYYTEPLHGCERDTPAPYFRAPAKGNGARAVSAVRAGAALAADAAPIRHRGDRLVDAAGGGDRRRGIRARTHHGERTAGGSGAFRALARGHGPFRRECNAACGGSHRRRRPLRTAWATGGFGARGCVRGGRAANRVTRRVGLFAAMPNPRASSMAFAAVAVRRLPAASAHNVTYVATVLPAHVLEVSRDNQYSLSTVVAAMGLSDKAAALLGSVSTPR